MPRSRLTGEQLAEITARKGYSVSSGSLPVQNSNKAQVLFPECGLVDGALAAVESKKAGAGRFLIRIEVYRKIPTDFDNQFCKWELDCLRYIGAISDDRQQDIRLDIAEQIKVKTDAEERIEISVFGPDSVEAKQANQK